MSDSARILAVESMAEAKAALAQFAQAVDRALSEADAEIQRMTQWLQHDRPPHWRKQVRIRQEAVLAAKTAISRKTIIAAPDPVRAVEERKALARAEAHLEEAQRRADATRRWAPVWEREAMGYKGRAHLLREAASGKIPEAISRLSRMMESVEAYLALMPPAGDSDAPPPDVGSGEPLDRPDPGNAAPDGGPVDSGGAAP